MLLVKEFFLILEMPYVVNRVQMEFTAVILRARRPVLNGVNRNESAMYFYTCNS